MPAEKYAENSKEISKFSEKYESSVKEKLKKN